MLARQYFTEVLRGCGSEIVIVIDRLQGLRTSDLSINLFLCNH